MDFGKREVMTKNVQRWWGSWRWKKPINERGCIEERKF